MINDDGWVSQITDKQSGNPLLKNPIRLALYDYEGSLHWPAWEIPNDAGLDNPHYPKLKGKRILESGPVRAKIELEYEYGSSTFTSVVTLGESSEAAEFYQEIIWQEFSSLLKQEFSLNAENEKATFDLGLGAIKRGNRTEKLYEVPAQKWADLSDGKVNVSVISDSKYSWDKPDNSTLRLTVLHTPKRNYRIDSMQSMMDLGLNRYSFAVMPHGADDFSKTNRIANNFHKPLTAFVLTKHSGTLSDEISFGRLQSENVLLRAMKLSEDSEGIVLRFNEINNSCQEKVQFSLNTEIEGCCEVNACEKKIAEAQSDGNSLCFPLEKYAVRSFKLRVKSDNTYINTQTPLSLEGNVNAFTDNGGRGKYLLPECRLSLPSEQAKENIYVGGVNFSINPSKKSLLCKGQKIKLPEDTKRVYLLAASLTKDKFVTFNNKTVSVNSAFENYAGWDLYDFGETAFIKSGKLGFEFTHTHTENADEIAKQAFFELIEIDISDGYLRLPDDSDILILAATSDSSERKSVPASELFEKAEKRPFTFRMTDSQRAQYKKFRRLWMMNDKGRYFKTINK